MTDTIDLAAEPPFQVGEVRALPAAREIAGPDGAVQVEPRIMQVLVLLARNRGEVVSRARLIDACWDGRIVGEDAVNRAILKLRRLAQDTGGSFAVETIPKVGYRLVEMNSLADAPPSPGVSRRGLIVGGAAVAAAAFGGFIWRSSGHTRSRRAQELYDRGQIAFQQGSRDDNAQAVGFFQQAAALAPHDGAILGALALAHRFEQSFLPPAALPVSTARTERAIAVALAADPHDPDAISAKALNLPFRGQWLSTERRMLVGLHDMPSSGVLHGFHGFLLADVGRTRAAIVELRRASHLERFVPLLRHRLAAALFADGQVGAAEHELDVSSALWPRFAELWWLRFWIYGFTGRPQQALAHLETPGRVPLAVTSAQLEAARLATEALTSRREADIDRSISAWQAQARFVPSLVPDAIALAASLGRADTAIAMAKDYFVAYAQPEGRRLHSTSFLFGTPMTSLWGLPDFAGICRLVGLVDYWRATGTRPDTRIA